MSITYSANLQSQIAINVTGVDNSSLPSTDKTRLDGTWTTGSLSYGAAKEALDEVEMYAQWLNMAGATAAPDKWLTWFIALASYKFAVLCRPERAELFGKSAERAFLACMRSFSRKAIDADPDDGTTGTLEAWSLTQQTIRYHVVSHCAHLDPPLYVPIENIDAATDSVHNELWCGYKWSFRKRFITLTITSASPTAPTNTLSGETFMASATRRWYYSDTDSGGNLSFETVDDDAFARLRARWGSETGRPVYAYVTQSGATKVWNFVPLPDTTYTATGFCFIAPPDSPTSATDTATFAKYPTPFRPLIKDMVLAKVLKEHQRDGGMWDKQVERVTALATEYEDQGEMDDEQSVRDVYGDASSINGHNAIGGSL